MKKILILPIFAFLIFVILSNNAYADPSISMSTTQATPGSVIQMTGSGFSNSDASVTVTISNLENYKATYSPVSGINCQTSAGGLTPATGTFVCPAEGVNQVSCPVSGGAFSCYFIVPSIPSADACDPNFLCSGNGLGTLVATGSSGDSVTQSAAVLMGLNIVPNEGPDSTQATLYGTGWLGLIVLKVLPILDVSLNLYLDNPGASAFDNSNFYQAVIGGIGGGPKNCLPVTSGELSDNGPCTFSYSISPSKGVHTITANALITADIPDKSYTGSFLVTTPSATIVGAQHLGTVIYLATTSGSSVTVTGSNFANSDTSVSIVFDSTNVTPSSGCPVSSDTFSCTFTAPSEHDVTEGNVLAIGNSGDTALAGSLSVIPTPSISLSKSSGPLGTTITITGSGFIPSDTTADVSIDVQGFGNSGVLAVCPVSGASITGTCSVTLPLLLGNELAGVEILPGSHTIIVRGNNGDDGTAPFTVNSPPPISLSTTSALPGTLVTATGSGFDSDTSVTLTFDRNNVTPSSGCPVSGGSFSCTFTVPSVPQGPTNTFVVQGNSGDGNGIFFTVLGPTISLSTSSGQLGSSVTVTGTLFSNSDTSVALTLGSNNVTPSSGCPVSGGIFSCIITVPNVPAKSYPFTVLASSGDTSPPAEFTVLNVISVSTLSGPPGTIATVTGSGFSSSDTSATITFGSTNATPSSSCPVTGGTFSCIITVPNVPQNSYPITVVGSSGDGSITQTFAIADGVSIYPTSGSIGTPITVFGTGFRGSSVDVWFVVNNGGALDQTKVATCPISGASNTLNSITGTCSFTMPPELPGTYTLSVNDFDSITTFTTPITIPKQNMVLSPSSGPVGSVVTINGIGFTSSDKDIAVAVGSNATGDFLSADCPATGGSFTCSIIMPSTYNADILVNGGFVGHTFNVPGGSYSFRAFGHPGGDSFSDTFTLLSAITLSPSSGLPGTSVTVTGSGFASSDTSVALTLGSNNVTPSSGCPVSNGGFSCTVTVPTVPEGSYTMIANGNSGDSASNGFTVIKGATTTTVSSSVNPSTFGQLVALTATISPVSPASGTPTGTVQFSVNGSNISSPVPLSGGTATLNVQDLSGGYNIITASYSGDSIFDTSNNTASPFVQTVNKGATTTTISSSSNNSVLGQEVTFTANISSVTPGIPTGTVAFYDGTTLIGTGSVQVNTINSDTGVASSLASIQISSLSLGTHSITTSYPGDGNFMPSTSSEITESIIPPAPAISSPANNTGTGGMPNISGISVIGDTTITIYDEAVQLGTTTADSSGLWSFTPLTALSGGKHTITATAALDGHTSESSSMITFIVDTAPPTLSITQPSDNSILDHLLTVNGTASDDTSVSSVTGKVDSGLISAATTSDNFTHWSFTTPSISTGLHMIQINATDSAGLITLSSINITINNCLSGTFFSSNSCVPAPQGSFVGTTGATSATLCPLGAFTSTEGSASCTPSPAGSFVGTTGATSATLCLAGSFTSSIGQSVCAPSLAGSYVPTTGSTTSTLCAPGSYQPNTGQTSCILANPGFFVSSSGAIQQTQCPPNTISDAPGSTTCSILTPAEQTNNLVNTINGMNLDHGTANSLDAKLNSVLNSLSSNQSNTAKNQLNAFINEVNAQTGKKITSAQASQLIAAAQNIINLIH